MKVQEQLPSPITFPPGHVYSLATPQLLLGGRLLRNLSPPKKEK